MSIRLSFCNDCDLMSWQGFKEIHTFLENIGLPAGDSFWLFDPSGSDMALFQHDLNHKGSCHDDLLEKIATGHLDVLHSVGSYGARFNRGYKPTRKLVAQALDYLAKHAKVPHIYTNHGDIYNIQNIGGAIPSPHHHGDDPNSDIYILDLLIEYGFEYFWLDRLVVRDAYSPYRILASEKCRSGHEIKTFLRFFTPKIDYSPNGNNLYQQLTPEELDTFQQVEQNIILYTHWGCHHKDRWAYIPEEVHPLSKESKKALECLAEMHHQEAIKVLRLYDLLKAEEEKLLVDEAQRIGTYVIRPDKEKKDNFYFNQYNRGVVYYQKRVEQLGVEGISALDAGCGVGQWAFALSNKFQEVVGIELASTAYNYLTEITERLRQTSPRFCQGNIELLPFDDQSFDFVFCYGVIMFTSIKASLSEMFRILKPGGQAYICLNGDGWYEYACDVRFKDDSELKLAHCQPLWHAWYARVGEANAFLSSLQSRKVRRYIHAKTFGNKEAYELISAILPQHPKDLSNAFCHYSPQLVHLLGYFFREYLLLLENNFDQTALKISNSTFSHHLADFTYRLTQKFRNIFPKTSEELMDVKPNNVSNLVTLDVPKSNRAYLPFEFEELTRSIGFVDFVWAPEGNLAATGKTIEVPPIYAPDYLGQVSVWECLFHKPLPESPIKII